LSKNIKLKIHRSIILPVALYWYEIWSPTLNEEHRLKVLENRRILGLRRGEVTGEYSLPNTDNRINKIC
jgi:hypothetical protein